MQIIKGRTIVEDGWQHVEDGAPLPEGKIIVSLSRWRTEREALIGRRNSGLGIQLASSEHAEDIAADLDNFEVVALNFPIFRDGRAFTTARLLRERYGFKGELRATGDVLRDQIFFMHRVGFDAFEVRPDRSIEDALKAFDDFTVTYQPSTDQDQPLWRRRG
ncbi:DUF934 domain-containing protein [Emcibacter sp. SYSU 3D8]|uniref:DUF934 domain-containing protein n=1 Tax=Emcibacter sp. SYSU 3D8 TaxID=3133969 RepID=UPI0031FEFA8C